MIKRIFLLLIPVVFLSASIFAQENIISNNDARAQSVLKTLCKASEIYILAHSGNFPQSINDLLNAKPPLINQNYCGSTVEGFTFSCEMSTSEYKFTATPLELGVSGSDTFIITTGGVLSGGKEGSQVGLQKGNDVVPMDDLPESLPERKSSPNH